MDGGTGHADKSALPPAPMLGQWQTMSNTEKSAPVQYAVPDSESTSALPPAPALGAWSTVPAPAATTCIPENQAHAEYGHSSMPNEKSGDDLTQNKSAAPEAINDSNPTNASDALNGTGPPVDTEETNQMIVEPPAPEPARFDFGSCYK